MHTKEQIKAIIQEAEIYYSQGLLDDAKKKYLSAAKILKNDDQLKKSKNLINVITRRIRSIENLNHSDEQASTTKDVQPHTKKLIKQLFSFSQSQNPDEVAFEGAIALAKFGQFDSAIEEFRKLLRRKMYRVVSAKNILRCHVELSAIKTAVDQLDQWLNDDLFTPSQSEKLHSFLDGLFKKKGIQEPLPSLNIPAPQPAPEPEPVPEPPPPEPESITEPALPADPEPVVETSPSPPAKNEEEPELIDISSLVVELDNESDDGLELPKNEPATKTPSDVPSEIEPLAEPNIPETVAESKPEEIEGVAPEEVLDINSVVLEIEDKSGISQSFELDVSFQSGNMISLIIAKAEADFLEALKVGDHLEDIQFYSSIAIFMGAGVVSGLTQIDTGPKKGDYCLDIKIVRL